MTVTGSPSVDADHDCGRIVEMFDGRLFAVSPSAEVRAPSHVHSMRDRVRGALRGVRDAVRPKPSLRNYFPCLETDPADCAQVILEMTGPACAQPTAGVFVNGRAAAPLQSERIVPGTWRWSFDPGVFERWENIVSVPLKWGVKQVRLMPAFADRATAQRFAGVKPSMIARIPDTACLAGADEALTRARNDSWRYILNARNLNRGSAFRGTFYAAYDIDRGTYCLGSWVWCSSAVVKALLDEHRLTGDATWLDIASSATEAMLGFQERSGPNTGGIMVRWDPSGYAPGGVIRWLAPNDSAFVGAYAFCEMHRATGDELFLRAAVAIGDWIISEGMASDGRLRVGYRLETNAWDDSWLYVDAGFCATLFDALYELTGDLKWPTALRLFMNWFNRTFYSGEGLYYRIWRSSGKMDKSVFARGQGWVLDGLLSAHSALEDEEWLAHACKLSDYLLSKQNGNGSWDYLLSRPGSGECNKGTPILAYHLLRLYKLTGNAAYLESVERAIRWCVDHIHRGDDVHAFGGISAPNAEGCIAGVTGTDTVFAYSSAYFILAANLLHMG